MSALIEAVLREMRCSTEVRRAIHEAKIAAGGWISKHYSDGYADEWAGLPEGFTCTEVIRSVCARHGVAPQAIGYLTEEMR